METLKRLMAIAMTPIFTILAINSMGTHHAFIYIALAMICSASILKELIPNDEI